MVLTDEGDLAIAELVYWAPALVLATLVTFKHGFARQLGWFFIILLALARIIGASCLIAAEQQTTVNTSLLAAAAITGSIGVSFLIQALLGLLTRVISGTPDVLRVPPRAWRLLHILLLVGIIIGIVGGVYVADGGKNAQTGHDLLKASTILFLAGLVLVAGALLFVAMNLRKVPSGERRLIIGALVALPFVFVRLLYSIIDVFVNNQTFNYFDPDIWVRAFMAVFEEFVAAGIIIALGFMTAKRVEAPPRNDPEAYQYSQAAPVQGGPPNRY